MSRYAGIRYEPRKNTQMRPVRSQTAVLRERKKFFIRLSVTTDDQKYAPLGDTDILEKAKFRKKHVGF